VLAGVVIIFVGVAVEGSAFALLEIVGSAVTPIPLVYPLRQVWNGAPIFFGAGFFLAALGLASRGPKWNGKILAGGLLVLIGSVGAASAVIYEFYLIFGAGGFPGRGQLIAIDALIVAFGLLSSIGIGVFLLEFVARSGPRPTP
jgi:hypothetical protein